jgi:hypothetical protein
MGYTSVESVGGMFPTFIRGIPQQKPNDDLIQQYIDDIAADINAVLSQRFQLAINDPGDGTLTGWLRTFPVTSTPWRSTALYNVGDLILDAGTEVQQVTNAGLSGDNLPVFSEVVGGPTPDGTVIWKNVSNDTSRILERINRYGGACQLAQTLGTFGNTAAREQGKDFCSQYQYLIYELGGLDKDGKPKQEGGMYDYLFDPESGVESPRSALTADTGIGTPADTANGCSCGAGGPFFTRGMIL